jgi:sn-glycerol 3-phosphate transport system substrate-binding protein
VARGLRGPAGGALFTPVGEALGGRSDVLGEPVVGDLRPAVRDHYTVGGRLQSWPLSATVPVLYVDAGLLRRLGIAWPPRTWREVEEVCAAVTGAAGGPERGITWANHGWLSQEAVAMQGGLVAWPDNGRTGALADPDPSGPEFTTWLRWWHRLSESGGYWYSGEPEDWQAAATAFLSGRVAMLVDSSKAASFLVGAGAGAGLDVRVAPLPRPSADSPAPFVSGDSLWLAAGLPAAVEEGALAFLQFLAGPEQAALWHRGHGYAPVTAAAADLLAAQGWFGEHPEHRTAVDELRASDDTFAALGPVLQDPMTLNHELAAACHDVLTDGADPADRLALAAARLRPAIPARSSEEP